MAHNINGSCMRASGVGEQDHTTKITAASAAHERLPHKQWVIVRVHNHKISQEVSQKVQKHTWISYVLSRVVHGVCARSCARSWARR